MRVAPVRSSLAFCRLTLFALLATGCVTPIQQERWVVVETENFEIFSTLSADEASELALELERFRGLIYTVTTTPRTAPPVPTRIVAFDRRLQYSAFAPSRNTAGVFIPTPRVNNVVLVDSSDFGATPIIFHEYVHFILRNGTNIVYPMWYDEGFAEVLSSAQEHRGQLVIGAVPRHRMNSFRYGEWLPLQRILEARSPRDIPADDQHMFYAEAWALAHYVTLDHGSTAGISAYLDFVRDGLPPTHAYTSAFGEDIGATSQAIKKKLERGDWRVIGIPLDKLEFDDETPRTRIPSAQEIATNLGQVQLSMGRGKEAQVLFASALELDPSSSRAQAGMGDALKFQDQYEAAGPYFRRSVELDPQHALSQLDLAEYLHELASRAPRGAERTQLLAEARAAYRASLEIDPDLPETHWMLGRTYLEAGEDPAPAIPLIEFSYARLPSLGRFVDSLAEAYLANGNEADARLVLSQSRTRRTSESVDEMIEAIRASRAEALAKLGGDEPI